MSIYEIIDQLLEPLKVDYYHGMPEFGEGEKPQSYITYTVREIPTAYASGVSHATRYFIATAAFTPGVDTALYDKIKQAFSLAGAVYSDGGDGQQDNTYPPKKRYDMDFILVL